MCNKRIRDLKRFLAKDMAGMQAFCTRNKDCDFLVEVYNKDGIVVELCSDWDYIEIFGITTDEFTDLLDENGIVNFIRRFTIEELI